MSSLANSYASVFYQHRQTARIVDRKLRQRIFNWVVVGHALGVIVPLALGILLGMFEPVRVSTMTLDITDFESSMSGPSALEQGDGGPPPPPPPTETPAEPQIPDPPDAPRMPTPSIVPDIPTVQESDSTERPIKPPPPKQPTAPKAPVIAQAKPPAPKPPKTPPQKPTTKPPATPVAPTGAAFKDNWKADGIGDGSGLSGKSTGGPRGGDNRAAGGDGSGGFDAEGKGGPYDQRLKAYIEMRWNPPPRAALNGTNPFVRIRLDIAPDGRVTRSVIETGSGMTMMDDSVRELLRDLVKVPAPGRFIKDKPIRLELQPE